MLYSTYLAAILLWIPLAIVASMAPSARGRLMVPLVASALGAVYQVMIGKSGGYTFAVVLIALCAVDAISGLVLIFTGRAHPNRTLLRVAGALCLAIPAAVMVVGGQAGQESRELDRKFGLGRQFRFETAFRDDATQKRIFGDLESATNPWAGYYVGGDEDRRFKHLVINAEGRYWLYSVELWDEEGKGRESASAPDTFEGQGTGRMNARRQLFLRRPPDGPLEMELRSPDPSIHNKPVPFRKSAPPRFPSAPSPADAVRFVGEFSTTYEEREKGFWLVQVWLWESKGEWWGRYIRDYYPRGYPREFIFAEAIEPHCASECNELSFKSGRGPVTLTRVSDDEFKAKLVHEEVTLRRGEKLPGFFFDLAPLATPQKNREWIEAVTAGRPLTWDVPPQ